MSVGSHFTLKSHARHALKAAQHSMRAFIAKHAPFAKFSYRKTRRGYVFWRIK